MDILENFGTEVRLDATLGASRQAACDTGLSHLWDFLMETKVLGEVEDHLLNTNQSNTAAGGASKTPAIINFIDNHLRHDLLENAMCSEYFMRTYGEWLATKCRVYGNKDRHHIASGTAKDLLSILKALLFQRFNSKAKQLFQCETNREQCEAIWYTQLRNNIEGMCGRRDLQMYGALQEGVKKKAIGRYLVTSMAKTDLKINTRDSILCLTQRGTVFNNAGM